VSLTVCPEPVEGLRQTNRSFKRWGRNRYRIKDKQYEIYSYPFTDFSSLGLVECHTACRGCSAFLASKLGSYGCGGKDRRTAEFLRRALRQRAAAQRILPRGSPDRKIQNPTP